MRMMAVCAAGLALVCAGCCAPRNCAPMTVETAMQQVAAGLNAFSAMPLDRRSGLMPAEITVVLNVSETQTRSAEAGGTLAAAANAPKLTVDFSRQNAETHGNTITLKFQNLLLADKTTLAGTKSPDELLALFNTLTNAGFAVKLAPPTRAP